MSDEHVTDYEIESGVFPAELLARDRWFVWALDNDRKIPRAPWANPDHIERYVSWKDEAMWTTFEEAGDWVEKLPKFGHASCIPAFEDNSVKRIIFFDFDDVRDPETGEIHAHAWNFIQAQGLHAAISTSGTGVHGFGWGSLPEGYKPSFERELPDWEHSEEPALEVYASARFMALTGEHIAGTPVGLPELGDTAHELFLRFGSERVTGTERQPELSRDELADVDTTTDVEDIYDAIAHTRPRDIRVRSTETSQRADGVVNMDPSWANSESGTRLAQFDDHWLYRKGNHRLDALQLVALEEGIINDESDYPSGDDFRDAVEALRDRGAHIPELEVKRKKPTLDVVKEANAKRDSVATDEAKAIAADDSADSVQPQQSETDGGATAAEPSSSTSPMSRFERFTDDVHTAISEADEEIIQHKTARHHIAFAFADHYDFVYPEQEVRGWRSVLYVYNPDEGVYEPRGKQFVDKMLERVAGDYVTNNVVNEIVGKIERMTIERGDAFDPIPERLVVGNGILNLHTGELENWTPLEYHRQKIDINWNPETDAGDEIETFLNDIVETRDVATLYRVIAHTLYKEYVNEKAIMLVGGGQNGKSVFLSLVEEFLGSWNVSHRALQDFDDNDFAANALEGKLANIHPDMGDDTVTDMSMFKKLTGRDTMMANVKFEAPITFENFATLMFAANEMPQFSEDNHAVWRRWVYINFPCTFDDTDPEAKDSVPKRVLMRRLTDEAELEALLVRCQQEIQKWWEGRDWYPDTMQPDEVRKQMKKAAEPVFDFATTCLEADDSENAYLLKADVRRAYRQYATEQGLPKIGSDRFGEQLVNYPDINIESARPRVNGDRVRVYKGVQWSSRGRQVMGLDTPDDDKQRQVNDEPQITRQVLEIMRDLVEENGGDPISRDMAVAGSAYKVGMTSARNAFDELKKNGKIVGNETDGWLPT